MNVNFSPASSFSTTSHTARLTPEQSTTSAPAPNFARFLRMYSTASLG